MLICKLQIIIPSLMGMDGTWAEQWLCLQALVQGLVHTLTLAVLVISLLVFSSASLACLNYTSLYTHTHTQEREG